MESTSASYMAKLATTIAQRTAILEAYYASHDGPKPSFKSDGLLNYSHLPTEIQQARQDLIKATEDLKALVTGPVENFNDQLSLNALLRLKIVDSFPIGSTTTYAEISKFTGLSVKNVQRFTRHAMMNHIFEEVSPGIIAHTAASRALVEDSVLRDWISMNTEEVMTASTRTLEAVEKYPNSQDMRQCGFQIANQTENVEPLFATLGKDPARARRFANAMSSLSDGEGYEISWLVDNYDWKSLKHRDCTVVDIGGSHGSVCVELGKAFPNMRFVVQDLPRMIQTAPLVAEEVRDRIRFEVHDFNTQQTVKDADVYLFRWIFHNLPSQNAINVLKQLIPALKHGARIVINDYCLPARAGEYSAYHEKYMRSMDLVMLTLLNSEERTPDEFERLFEQASDKFRFVGVTRPEGCRMSIIEAIWEGEDYDGL